MQRIFGQQHQATIIHLYMCSTIQLALLVIISSDIIYIVRLYDAYATDSTYYNFGNRYTYSGNYGYVYDALVYSTAASRAIGCIPLEFITSMLFKLFI